MPRRTLQTRSLTCPHCGAKLHWEQDAPVIECRYCQTHVVVTTGRQTNQPTTVISTVAPSRGPKLAITIAAVAAVIVAGTSIAVMSRQRSAPGTTASAPVRTSTIAELAATPLASTPEAVAKLHGSKLVETTVVVNLSDGPFSSATFYWEKDHRDHVASVSLHARTQPADFAQVVERARAQLGRRLRPTSTGGHQFMAKAVGFSTSERAVSIRANPGSDPAWKTQLAAMWTVLRGAALGTSDTLDDRTRRDVLNLTYPLTVLAEIPWAVVVDNAAAEVARVVPGVDSDGPRHTIGLGHPWFESASLGWNNEPNGKWYSAILYYPPELDFASQHAALTACVSPLLGEPKKLVSDHLAGTFTLQFEAKNGRPWVNATPQVFQIFPHYTFGTPATEQGFHDLIAALAACGT